VLLMLAWAGVSGAAAATICGDADGDGVVTITDGVRILRLAAALDETCATTGCDVDGSGQVSVTDAVLALRRAAGLTIVDGCGGGTITGRLLIAPAGRDRRARAERRPEHGNVVAGSSR
jgi:hypothetical protein